LKKTADVGIGIGLVLLGINSMGFCNGIT